MRGRARARCGVACLVVAAAVAGCSSSSSSTGSVTATGTTLYIYLSEPGDLLTNPVQQDIVHAEQLAFQQEHAEVKDYAVQLVTVRSDEPSNSARTAIEDESAIAYLGEVAPGTSEQSVGITNALDLLEVSPTDNALELTQKTAAISGAPSKYYESLSSYGHTFARVAPSAAQEADYDAQLIRAQGAGSVYVADDGSDYGRAIAQAVRADAASASLTVDGSESGAAAIFYGATSPGAAAKYFNAAATSNPTAKLFGSSSLNSPVFMAALSSAAASRTYISSPGFLTSALGASGASFLSTFKTDYHHAPNVEAIFGYAAMSTLLHVLKEAGASANNRGRVVRDFLTLKSLSSVLGTFSIDKSGNTSLRSFVYLRPSGAVRAGPSSSAQG